MTVVFLIYRIVVSIFMIPAVLVFFGAFSVSQEVNDQNYEEFLENATLELFGRGDK